MILGAYTNMRVAIVVTDVGRRGEGELQQHRQQAAKSEWQLARLDLWPIAIGLGCQHDTVTNIGADYCSSYCCFAPLPSPSTTHSPFLSPWVTACLTALFTPVGR